MPGDRNGNIYLTV